MFTLFTHVAAHISSLLLLWLNNIPFVAIPLFVYQFINGWAFLFLIMDNAAIIMDNICEHIFALKYVFNYFRYISMSSFAGFK